MQGALWRLCVSDVRSTRDLIWYLQSTPGCNSEGRFGCLQEVGSGYKRAANPSVVAGGGRTGGTGTPGLSRLALRPLLHFLPDSVHSCACSKHGMMTMALHSTGKRGNAIPATRARCGSVSLS